MDLEIVILTDSKSNTEMQISYNVPYTWNLKDGASELIYEVEIDSQTESRLVAKGMQGGEGRHGSLGWEDVDYYILKRGNLASSSFVWRISIADVIFFEDFQIQMLKRLKVTK